MFQHTLAIRVYYEDTDVGGIVHHANYLKFFERGRIEALRAQGFDLSQLFAQYKAQFVVHSAELLFLQPARLDQVLSVITEVIAVRQASILYNQLIRLTLEESQETRDLCQAKIKLACLDDRFCIQKLPSVIVEALAHNGELK